MFYSYSIKNNGHEDILYLYLDLRYEFSNELDFDSVNLDKGSIDFIKTNDIKFKGKTICIVLDGKIVKKIDISKLNLNNEMLVDNFLVNIYLKDNSLCELSLREYLLSILFPKYLECSNREVLKAIAILYQTFAFKMMSENKFILSTNRFATFKALKEYKDSFSNYEVIIKELNIAIDEVDGLFLSYKNNYILPFIHFSNSGKTLGNKNYPYLSSVKSLWDLASPYYIEVKDFSFEDLSNKLNIFIDKYSDIGIIKNSNNYKKLKIGKAIFSEAEIMSILNLKSDDIYIIINNDSLRFITKGMGRSYGLSIFGANEIAKNGGKAFDILKYFFPKTTLMKKIK